MTVRISHSSLHFSLNNSPHRQMEDSTNQPTTPWTAPPTAKERNAVQRAVTALLDELAPERVLSRTERIPVQVEQHRTPSGCVLQAPTAAVSVSWFPDTDDEVAMGELDVIVWRGVVSRRGAPPRREGATVAGEMVLRPVEGPSGGFLWRAEDGTTYDTDTLAARCLALLEEHMGTDSPSGPAK
ncbi:MAG TPA: hypothetical protein VIQ74_17955 [Gemmatimonadaceae bacterium]